ncbi:sigma-70 family RNA polymerase sigma factor [Gloeobacter morelensis]|uniref:Sigma-70 family RNA polymerase sigma factor n=1 Tax=Gloeobacter morelensis MG652769 TaxID=2781736 RepID=A0ABY3PRY6_9CYAN|nr:sigma-70 family RNA polymerase sigma factor [Gloeobacter morelensis]UFP96493.1 sigma-70 family RNA polymerase sigma factor [Gloeobacter morelensis MG652769]
MTGTPKFAGPTRLLLRTYGESPSTALRNELVCRNLGLVRKIAHQLARGGSEPFEDLVQVGAIGLLRAVERFDPSLGHAFSSFATPCIRGAIQHYLRDHGHGVRLPRRLLELDSRARRAAHTLSQRHGCTPSERQIASALGISAEEWLQVRLARANRTLVSLDAPAGSHPDTPPLVELLPGPDTPEVSPEGQERAHLARALAQLEAATQAAVRQVYLEKRTQSETARRLGVSPMTISRRLKKGTGQLHTLLQRAL